MQDVLRDHYVDTIVAPAFAELAVMGLGTVNVGDCVRLVHARCDIVKVFGRIKGWRVDEGGNLSSHRLLYKGPAPGTEWVNYQYPIHRVGNTWRCV